MVMEPDAHRRLQQRLHIVLQRMCPPWMKPDVDDLVQAAHLKIHRRGDDLEALPSRFLYRVGHSVMVDEIRRRGRRREVAADDAPEPSDAPTADPEHRTLDREIGTHIQQALTELRWDQRRAVALYLHGHSVPEIADLLGWTPKKAENHVYRGLAALRELLTARGVRP